MRRAQFLDSAADQMLERFFPLQIDDASGHGHRVFRAGLENGAHPLRDVVGVGHRLTRQNDENRFGIPQDREVRSADRLPEYFCDFPNGIRLRACRTIVGSARGPNVEQDDAERLTVAMNARELPRNRELSRTPIQEDGSKMRGC